MSRSYKKTPLITEGSDKAGARKVRRRLANRRVRRADVANGASFKKVSNSWDICDFKFKVNPTKKNLSK